MIKDIDIPYKSALSGIQQFNDFSRLFFSRQNMDWIQTHLRYEIYKKSGNVIGRQDDAELIIIMRSVYLEKSKNPSDVSEYTENILELNNDIIKTLVPKIIIAVNHDKVYQRIKLKPGRLIDRPVNVNITGTKGLRGPSDVQGIHTL